MNILEIYEDYLNSDNYDPSINNSAQQLVSKQKVTLLSYATEQFDFLVSKGRKKIDTSLSVNNGTLLPTIKDKAVNWEEPQVASLIYLLENQETIFPIQFNGKKYTREGMKHRVLEERVKKAKNAKYKIEFADNIYGEHTLYNEKGVEYKITLRDFKNETGYINSHDLSVNKLGTTKHIMYTFNKLKKNRRRYKKLSKQYPFVEIFLDPINNYKISWYYPHELPKEIGKLIKKFFKSSTYIEDHKAKAFLSFLQKTESIDKIKVRQEVVDKVETAFSNEMLYQMKSQYKPDFSCVSATLFPYQKEGINFAIFKKSVIIADDMGLGKTLQAIATAIIKKQVFGFKKTLIICPSSLKQQWKTEIEKFTSEKATIIEGFPKQRKEIYVESKAYFLITNYESVRRDINPINNNPPDFVILDEAQRIKNYQTQTAAITKRIQRKHALIITGTPIENRLIDLYSVVQFLDQQFLAPLWEFSYQHCYFSQKGDTRILGYYNLQQLKKRMQQILIRREKREVIKELPSIQEITIPVSLHIEQRNLHTSYSRGVAKILAKKFKTEFDMQRLLLLLTKMRMVCNSTFLIDKKTRYSTKLIELKHVLQQKLDIKNQPCKIIIFTEWVAMNQMIGEMLEKMGVAYQMLTGKVPVKKRKELIKTFETDPNCKVFLSTEAGGTGLNLQIADTVINFELPWNPAKKNQRIGRIDRIGQKAGKLLVINFVCYQTIESRIATGLLLKQNLFEGVFNDQSTLDNVDFSAKGRSQFIAQLETMIDDFQDEDNFENESEDELTQNDVEMEEQGQQAPIQDTINQEELIEEKTEEIPEPITSKPNKDQTSRKEQQNRLKEMETVMNQGLSFLAGMYKMSTGKELASNNQKVEIDKETGEVVMRFKIDL